MIEILVLVISFVLSLIVISFSIYNFQIKEYRLDRLGSYIKEKSMWFFLVPERFYIPKKSVRNRNIVIISLILLTLYLFVVLLLIPAQGTRVVLYFLSPIISILFVILGVLYTATIVKRKRTVTISEAVEMVNKSKASFIGITGSFGKTSTKEFLYEILSSKFEVAKTDENQNTDIGVAMSIISNLKETIKYFIVEMGAYKKGEIKKISEMVGPKYGILTGLSNQHISLFGSVENLIEAKAELLNSLPKEGKAYVNADSLGYDQAVEGLKCAVCLYSLNNKKTDVYLKSFVSNGGTTEAIVSYSGINFTFKTKLFGKHNVENILPCIALAYDLGVSKEQIENAIEKIKPIYGRLSLHEGLDGINFLYDGYSSNIKGFLAATEILGNIGSRRKVLITKGIIELGKDKEASYKEILKSVYGFGIQLITTDVLFKKLDDKNKVVLLRSEGKILDLIKKELEDGDTVLIEGRFSDNFISRFNLK